MSKIKTAMMKGMNAVMLDCDRATLFITKSEVDKLACLQRVQLKMHLMGCKLCRAFAKQSKFISKELDTIKIVNPDKLTLRLTVDQKERIQQKIDMNLN